MNTHQQHQKDMHAEAQKARLRKLALQSQHKNPAIYRSMRVQAGRGLIAAGRFLVAQSGETSTMPLRELQREV